MKKEKEDLKKENVQFVFPKNRSAAIKVIGVGGGGSNALSYMFEQGITGVDFIACNTDAQALNNNPVPVKIQLGASITEGLGAGADPEVGEKAALESLEEIKSILDSNTKMTFITAGMGGGTGTGAAPIIAGISKEKGILTVGIVTIPFHFEGKMRLQQAQKGIESLRKNVDSLIVINNDKLRELYGNLGFKAGFAKADEVLTTAAKGIAEVITHHYKQNIDLRDTRTVLKESGTAVMGSAVSVGENRAKEAVGQALDSPLLNDNKITGAKNVLLLIVSGKIEITIDEIGIISDYIQAEAGNNANIIMGIGEDESLDESISVTIVATGFPTEVQRAIHHEEKKIFHRLEEPYKQKLAKVEGIHSYSQPIDSFTHSQKTPKNTKSDYSGSVVPNNKGDLSSNQKKNIFNQAIENTSSISKEKYKRYMMLEDNFDLPISYEERNKLLKERMKKYSESLLKKEPNKNEDDF
ncbi:cell division protein FtsZ [Blattabacterium cuenoti]|uniref:cell division protein FtsZ n=1 Tax=Blattabacterium cuenoti TaxID=1653831 RepID=UPI00163C6AC0|nr:cell division protein FtsZ [Blattabacterium cuenoti]